MSTRPNHWLSRQKEGKEYLLRFDGDQVRAVFTTRYRPVDNHDVLNRLLDLGFREEDEVQGYCDPGFMSVSIPNWDKGVTLKGDRQVPGISIANSEIGISSLKIAAFFLRLVCTNGLVIPVQGESRGYRHVSATLLQDFPEIIQRSITASEDHAHRISLSMESPVEKPEDTFKTLNRQFLLSGPEQEAVDWGFEYEPGGTLFHIVNAYTKGAQHPPLGVESRYRLQRVGGSILEMVH